MRIIGLAGWSGAGKTTLLAKALPRIVARGLTVSTLKHAHHSFDLDQPGKDSHTHRMAGATEVLIASVNRYALMHELRGAERDLLVFGHRRYARGNQPLHLADRKQRTRESETIVGQLRHAQALRCWAAGAFSRART